MSECLAHKVSRHGGQRLERIADVVSNFFCSDLLLGEAMEADQGPARSVKVLGPHGGFPLMIESPIQYHTILMNQLSSSLEFTADLPT